MNYEIQILELFPKLMTNIPLSFLHTSMIENGFTLPLFKASETSRALMFCKMQVVPNEIIFFT
jgi:hypothetical protein